MKLSSLSTEPAPTTKPRPSQKIGVVLTVPFSMERGDTQSTMLRHILRTALRADGVLVEEEASVKYACVFDEIVGMEFVTSYALAFESVKRQLLEMSFLDAAQIAWHHEVEGLWIDLHPINPAVPFLDRVNNLRKKLDAVAAQVEANNLARLSFAAALGKLARKLSDQQ